MMMRSWEEEEHNLVNKLAHCLQLRREILSKFFMRSMLHLSNRINSCSCGADPSYYSGFLLLHRLVVFQLLRVLILSSPHDSSFVMSMYLPL